jgi:hypothetical protein
VTTETTGPADPGGIADAPEANAQARLYYERVVAALSGLAPDVRQDLLEDLPDHLAEVAAEISAEGSGSLRDRLGEPEAYALELRAAAGLEAAPPVAGTMATGLAQGARRASELARRLDLQGGRLVGYPRLQDLLRALRPGWWVLRGWLGAELVAGAHDRESWSGFIPDIGGSRLLGLLVTLAMIAASVALGQRSLGLSAWGRRAVAAASVLIALWGVGVLATNVGGTAYAYSGPDQDYVERYSGVRDVYVYDRAGQLVDGARLFDQDGNPIHLGTGYCADGQPAPGANLVPGYLGYLGYRDAVAIWSYPLCPAEPGPFRSGPPPLPSAPSQSLPDQSGSPQLTGPAPSVSPSASSTVAPSTVAPSTVAPSTVAPSTVTPSTKPTASSTRR